MDVFPWSPSLWTVGHSVLELEVFLDRLQSHGIRGIADVRRYPASRRHPHFNADALAAALAARGIAYRHFPDLGGRRNPRPDSPNTNWRNAAFRGYADHMETPVFRRATEELEAEASARPTAVMCSEAVWWRCHRGLIADWFKARGHTVRHILDHASQGEAKEHPWTGAARLDHGVLRYDAAPGAADNLLL